MNAHITQKNGLNIHLSFNEYRVFLDFSNDCNSISLNFPRESAILKEVLFAIDIAHLVTRIEIQGFTYLIVNTEKIINYDDIRYHLNINNFLFELDRQTYVQLHYFLSNLRELQEHEKPKQEW